MTSIVNGLAALIAMVAVGIGSHQLAVTPAAAHHRASAAAKWTPSYADPDGTDTYTWLHGHNNRPTVIATPEPVATPAEAEAAAPAPAAPAVTVPAYHAPVPPPAPAPAPITVGSTQQAYINSDRAGAGLGGLNWSSCLAGIAYQSALRMANQGFISHAGGASQDLGCGLGSQGGENVGYWSAGINDPQLNTMFMNSPEHRANIMGPYHYVGTAWVVAKNGYAYIAVEFS